MARKLTLLVAITFMALEALANASPAFELIKSSDDLTLLMENANVTLECVQNLFRETQMTSISRIRILKKVNGASWTPLAELRDNENDVKVDSGVVASGHIGNDGMAAFVRVTLAAVSDSTFGQYRCDVIGFDSYQNIVIENNSNVTVEPQYLTSDELYSILSLERQHYKQQIADHEEELIQKLEFQKEHFQQELAAFWERNRQELAHERVYIKQEMDRHGQNERVKLLSILEALNLTNIQGDQLIQSLETNMTTILDASDIDQHSITLGDLYADIASLNQTLRSMLRTSGWPEGSFGLLQPRTGCPEGGAWHTGYNFIHTESSDKNYDNILNAPHMSPDTHITVGGDNFMTLPFCVITQTQSGPTWPKGQYCISRRGGVCPLGFETGYVRLDHEDTDHKGRREGYFPDFEETREYFCCRDDGSHDTPIFLPTASPFYLYRYQGHCQQVLGTTVTNEYIIIDTENTNNNDLYENAYHPDGSLNNFRLELCHYQP